MGWLYAFSRKMKNSKMGNTIFNILDDIGIRIVFGRFINWKSARYDEKHPSVRMINSRKYFAENKSRIKKVIDLLGDEESKDVLQKMIRFRCFSIYNELPYNSMRTQYFVNDFFRYREKEVYIDCGAYDGDSLRAFKKYRKKSGLGGGKMIAFEPDETNYSNLVRNHPDIMAISAGVWIEDGVLSFEKDGSGSNFLAAEKTIDLHDNKDTVKVSVKCLDNMRECQDATFIKMDIEGSEYNALLGARKIICKNKPKLAICIYHSDEDMLRLIELIHEMEPEYHLYVRQHSNSIGETVLYATL